MKKLIITFCVFTLIFASCNQTTRTQQAETTNNEIVCETEKLSQFPLGNKENPLFGKIYRDEVDIPELSRWEYIGGAVLGYAEIIDGRMGFRFAIDHFIDDNDNIFVFVELVGQRDERGRRKSKILDTVNIGKLKENEIIERPICLLVNSVEVCQILAVFVLKDKAYCEYSGYLRYDFYGNIELVRAWRINMDTGRFEVIDIDTERIDFIGG